MIAPYSPAGGAMTLVSDPLPGRVYTIFWDRTVFDKGADNVSDYTRSTLIHELTHVWQGEHGVTAVAYVGQSGWAQLKHGIRDILKKERWEGWDTHRNTAYEYDAHHLGRQWNSFNVEQQGNIVQHWYERGMSPHDPRYPYIVYNILRGDRNAGYIPIRIVAAPRPMLGAGASLEIKEIQDELVALGYLEAKHADGYMGRFTRDAVRNFQARNSLFVDGDIGGVNSRTRAKFRLPLNQLRGAR